MLDQKNPFEWLSLEILEGIKYGIELSKKYADNPKHLKFIENQINLAYDLEMTKIKQDYTKKTLEKEGYNKLIEVIDFLEREG